MKNKGQKDGETALFRTQNDMDEFVNGEFVLKKILRTLCFDIKFVDNSELFSKHFVVKNEKVLIKIFYSFIEWHVELGYYVLKDNGDNIYIQNWEDAMCIIEAFLDEDIKKITEPNKILRELEIAAYTIKYVTPIIEKNWKKYL